MASVRAMPPAGGAMPIAPSAKRNSVSDASSPDAAISPSRRSALLAARPLVSQLPPRLRGIGQLQPYCAVQTPSPAIAHWGLHVLTLPQRRGSFLISPSIYQHEASFGSLHIGHALGAGGVIAVRLLRLGEPLVGAWPPSPWEEASKATGIGELLDHVRREEMAPGPKMRECAFLRIDSAAVAEAFDVPFCDPRPEARHVLAVISQACFRGSLADWLRILRLEAQSPTPFARYASTALQWPFDKAFDVRAALALQVWKDVGEALVWLKGQNWLHGAIVPEHILWGESHWVLTDYRYAVDLHKDVDASELAWGRGTTHAPLGFWAPESFARLTRPQTLAYDVWALGGVLQQCLALPSLNRLWYLQEQRNEPETRDLACMCLDDFERAWACQPKPSTSAEHIRAGLNNELRHTTHQIEQEQQQRPTHEQALWRDKATFRLRHQAQLFDDWHAHATAFGDGVARVFFAAWHHLLAPVDKRATVEQVLELQRDAQRDYERDPLAAERLSAVATLIDTMPMPSFANAHYRRDPGEDRWLSGLHQRARGQHWLAHEAQAWSKPRRRPRSMENANAPLTKPSRPFGSPVPAFDPARLSRSEASSPLPGPVGEPARGGAEPRL